MAYRSSLNLSSINKSLKSLSANISDARKSAQNVGQTILDTNRQKRKAISRNSSLFRRRREAVRRKEREDIVEASTITGAVNRTKTAVINSSKGFLGRILDFLGTLLVGWAIINLPNIIKMAENLMNRMKEYFLVLEDFKSGLQEFLITFGDTVGQVTSSISNFDFISTARIMRTQMGKMKTSFERMENSLNRALTMLRQDAYKILGIDPPEEETTESEGSENEGRTSGQVKGSGTRTGTREERAMLDAIAFAEGTRDQVDNGYRTHFGFDTFDGGPPVDEGELLQNRIREAQRGNKFWNMHHSPMEAIQAIADDYGNIRCQIKLFKGNTKETLPDNISQVSPVDFVYIDGGHSYETVKSDYLNVKPVLKTGTTVVFDDFNCATGVSRFIGELLSEEGGFFSRVMFLPSGFNTWKCSTVVLIYNEKESVQS